LMGSPESEQGRRDDEGPQHEVQITRPFYLGMYPVTQRQYRMVTGANPSWFSAEGGGNGEVVGLDTGHFPVERVNWEEAQAFLAKLSELQAEAKAGRRYRLPTEAEWEYACRAGTTSPFHCGDSLSSAEANFKGGLGRTCAVGSYPANGWG